MEELNARVVDCKECPRLVAYREGIARTKRRQYSHMEYWGRPVPGFGDPEAKILLVGLAPAAHGGNRTGRVFTGDRSGDFLMRMLHKSGLANQPNSTDKSDGLKLWNVYITAAVKSAPPENKPSPNEIHTCSLKYLGHELEILQSVKAIVCLGQLAFKATIDTLRRANMIEDLEGEARFEHGREFSLGKGKPRLFCSYHPSPRNTQTGTLTEEMFLSIIRRASRHAGSLKPQPES